MNFIPIANWTQQPAFPASAAQGQVWHIHNLHHSHVEDYMTVDPASVHAHYIRAESIRVVDYLDNRMAASQTAAESNHPKLLFANLNGSAGAGKSTLVWGWFQRQSGRRVWIHHDHEGEYGVVELSSAPNGPVVARSGTTEHLHAHLEALLEQDVTLVVLDGSFPKGALSALYKKVLQHRIFAVSCMSEGVVISGGLRTHFEGDTLTVNGWTLDEITAAQAALHPGQMTEDAIKAKHYFSGGSARLFWGYNRNDNIRLTLDELFKRVAFTPTFFSSGGGGQEHSADSLCTYLDGHPVMVSEYAARACAAWVDKAFIHEAKAALPKKPSYQQQGWVTVMEMLWRARRACLSGVNWTLLDRNGAVEFDHRIAEYRAFISQEAIAPAALHGPASAHEVLFVPLMWCNHGYDAIYVHYQGTVPHIKVLLCTESAFREGKLQNVASFLERLLPLGNQVFRSPVVTFRVVTRRSNMKRFALDQGLEELWNFDKSFGAKRTRGGAVASTKLCSFDDDVLPL